MPQTWNRYAYVGNNPLRFVDNNGLWWTQTHNAALQEALPGLTADQLKSVQAGSLAADPRVMGLDSQLPSMSYVHAMSDGTNPDRGNAIDNSMQEEDQFISAGQAKAISLQAEWIASGHTGLSPQALQEFGNFTHPLVDSTSPAHEGYQPWGGWSRLSTMIPGIGGSCVSFGGAIHAMREGPWTFRGQRRQDTINIIRYWFLQTFGDQYAQVTRDPEADRKSSHAGCLLDRSSGNCVQ